MWRFVRRYWYAYAMVLPVVVVLGVLVLLPLAQGVYFTFTDINESNIANPVLDRPASYQVVGLRNYLNVLSGDSSYGAFWATLGIGIASLLLFAIGAAAAAWAKIFALGVLAGGAAALIGALLGFLFGLPRVGRANLICRDAEPQNSDDDDHQREQHLVLVRFLLVSEDAEQAHACECENQGEDVLA